MATWISHLRLAERLLAAIPNLDAAYFAIGSLAPDSGIRREDGKGFDPPSQVTHFKPSASPEGKTIEDLAFYRKYSAQLSTNSPDTLQRSFLLGYFFHLVTDRLHDIHVVSPALAALNTQHGSEVVEEFKKDWYGQDFIYLRDHPNWPLWQLFLDAEYQHDYLDHLPAGAIRQQMENIKKFYQRTDEAVQQAYAREYPYVNKQQMDADIDFLASRMQAVHQRIWVEGATLGSTSSALELLGD
ncbi:MAG: zinc dependent phospholipase C family protein [Anaerolineales bacterium]|nr:zinc dependent phospholipase C family protein [Anaerolineales bacterium]